MVHTDCLGREREVSRTYPDGSFDCPFCSYAVIAERQETRCSNPWCSASSYCFNTDGTPRQESADRMRAKIAEEQRRQAEEEQRRASHQATMRRLEEDRRAHQEWEQATITEARKRGACVRCVFQ